MLGLFWFLTGVLLACVYCFLGHCGSHKMRLSLISLIALASYGLYWKKGSYPHLKHYYGAEQVQTRRYQGGFRRLMIEFKKEEFRLRLQLEQNPGSIEAQWRLFDLLATEALYHQKFPEALQYWASALKAMPLDAAHQVSRDRILKIVREISLQQKPYIQKN